MVVRGAHIHITDVFTGATSIRGHTSGPAHAITRCGTVLIFQGFVFDVGIGVVGKAPDSGDLLVHVGG